MNHCNCDCADEDLSRCENADMKRFQLRISTLDKINNNNNECTIKIHFSCE